MKSRAKLIMPYEKTNERIPPKRQKKTLLVIAPCNVTKNDSQLIRKKAKVIRKTWKKNGFLNLRKNRSEINPAEKEKRHAANRIISSKKSSSMKILA